MTGVNKMAKGSADRGTKGKVEDVLLPNFPKGRRLNKEEVNKLVNKRVKAGPKTVDAVLRDLVLAAKLKVEHDERGRRIFYAS